MNQTTMPPAGGEQLYRQLVESVRDYAMFLLDADGRIATWNPGAHLIKGYAADEVIGTHFSRFYTPEDRAAGRPQLLLDTAAASGRVEDEGWRVRRDGSRFWAEVVITSRRDDAGTLLGFAKVTRDMTARRMADEQLRRSEERARLIVEGVRDYAIFMLDPSGRISSWNAGAERIKGYTADEIVGTSFGAFYPEEDLRSGKPAYELEVAARDGRFEDEGWRVRKDGSTFWANVVITALRDSHGALVGYAKVTRDLTERKTLEEERLRAARAEEAVRVRDEFVAVVAHELRTPLTAINLGLHGVAERLMAIDEAMAGRIARVVRSGKRLANLVERLIDVSRLSGGALTLVPERVDLRELVELVSDTLQPTAERAECELRTRMSGDGVGHWDRVRLEQVVSNLLDNAIKFGTGKPIDLELVGHADRVELVIGDRGPGVEDDDLVRIFGRFERAADLRNHPGLGLGLYVARRIAEAHGGSLSARRREGGGTEFVLELPRAAPAPASKQEAS